MFSLGAVGAVSVIAPKVLAGASPKEDEWPRWPDPSESGGPGQHPHDYLTWGIPTAWREQWLWAQYFKGTDPEVGQLIALRQRAYERILEGRDGLPEHISLTGGRGYNGHLSRDAIRDVLWGRASVSGKDPISCSALNYALFGNSFLGCAFARDHYGSLFWTDPNEIILKDGEVLPTEELTHRYRKMGFVRVDILHSVPTNPLGTKELAETKFFNGVGLAIPAWFKSFKYLLWKEKCREKGLDPEKAPSGPKNPIQREMLALGQRPPGL